MTKHAFDNLNTKMIISDFEKNTNFKEMVSRNYWPWNADRVRELVEFVTKFYYNYEFSFNVEKLNRVNWKKIANRWNKVTA